MAFTVKTNTLVEDYDWLSPRDPSMDTEAEDFDERWRLYEDGQGDPPIKPGHTPTVFRLRHLAGRYFKAASPFLSLAAESPEHAYAASWAVTAVVLKGVENLKNEEGKNVTLRFDRDRYGVSHMDDDSLEMIGIDLVSEICQEALKKRTTGPL